MSISENILPQEGTGCLAFGESFAGPHSLVSPTVSGGGKNRLRDASPSQRLCSREEEGRLIGETAIWEDNNMEREKWGEMSTNDEDYNILSLAINTDTLKNKKILHLNFESVIFIRLFIVFSHFGANTLYNILLY
jgi:hypothetical protein